MRIGLNLLHASPRIGGGWNYISNIVKALELADNQNHYVLFTNHASHQLLPKKDNFSVVRIDLKPEDRVRRVLFEQKSMQRLAREHGLDLLHWFANTCGVTNAVHPVVTIYDLLAFREPKSFSAAKGLYLRTLIRHTAKRAFLLPMSSATAADLASILGVTESRMRVIPTPIPDEFRKKYSLPSEFWVYVAHYNPHKNHRRLLAAYAQLRTRWPGTWPLVLRGDTKDETGIPRYITEFGLQDSVIELPRLHNGEMPLLYSAATALVFPSLFEGGGMPLMEAMSCGCPVAASNIPTTIEFGHDAVLQFDPRDPGSISQSMLQVQADDRLLANLRTVGLKRAEHFSTRKIGLALKTTYLELGRRTHH
jgi:glycosyltransferase involved in cell wall biosynthesis